ncbi:MAG: MBL fold metallo-hydrolase [Hydrogenophaga sp.]|uniref:MBL fold metallo-hydrolase n=1 Tax=Hydrogenophaga sp. TaxID=1904254 RepID=UPI0027622E14|nr:MBL fold metallo-hydrolase [Hydrogenophaga sp.]MDP2419391.1 MBL fold metallo-hydrolase [Hydrogenophaga sp.]MDZ4187474.1 MBL fold metallo-hydrolase [Hydrogenophaga sp.]
MLTSAGITFFERGWLSANNILIQGEGPTALVDTGYCSHANQTLALVEQILGGKPLDLILNTHLHSDHCGGNAALQQRYPQISTHIPPGHAHCVADWDPVALTYEPTGQYCPPFRHNAVLLPGTSIRLGSHTWQIHAAEGHDPHSIVLFQPEHRVLLSADALWENGFGVVFPELEGIAAFDEVAETLNLIEQLNPLTVVPGHGSVFHDISDALHRARAKLDYFVKNPAKHHRHGLKVLVKYKLLEWQSVDIHEIVTWAFKTAYLRDAMPFKGQDAEAGTEWVQALLNDLERNNALVIEGSVVRNV